MTKPGSFSALVMTTHRQLDGRATAKEVARHVASTLDREAYQEKTWRGFVGQVASCLRQTNADTGLPEAPCIDGQYIQDALLTSEELRRLTVQSTKRGREFFARATAYANRHLDVYGVAIDPATGQDIAAA